VNKQEFIDLVKQCTENNFQKDKYVCPLIVFLDQNNKIGVFPITQISGEKDKDDISDTLIEFRKKFSIVAFLTEAWVSAQPQSDSLVKPSNDPDKSEVVTVTLYEGNDIQIITAEILRHGDTCFLGPWNEHVSGNDLNGRFCRRIED
jgi:hypothetical protein